MDAGTGLGEENLEIRRRAKLKEKEERRKALSQPDMAGIDATYVPYSRRLMLRLMLW
jgi:hypothetical protein